MILIWFCQILQEGCDMLSFFLLSPLPSFLLLFLFAWGLSGCPAQPYSQKFLPLSCYQRVFGLCVHTCQTKALTKVWPFWGETMMVHWRQKHSLSLPCFFCSPYHAYPKVKSLPIFMSMLFEYGLWWVGRTSSQEQRTETPPDEAIGSLLTPQ